MLTSSCCEQRDARQIARHSGWAGLVHLPAVGLAIMRFLSPAPDRLHVAGRVCRGWHALAHHPSLCLYVRVPPHGRSDAAALAQAAALEAAAATAAFAKTGGLGLKNKPAQSASAAARPARLFDDLASAVAAARDGDSIVVASGSHYVPTSLVVDKPIRIVSQARYSFSNNVGYSLDYIA
jgi:hypothetical protein